MTRPNLPKILLLEDPAGKEKELAAALREEPVDLRMPAAGADLTEALRTEAPDLIVVDARLSESDLARLLKTRAPAALQGPNVLALIPPAKRPESDDSGVDFLSPARGSEEIIARIRWHLRLEELRKRNRQLEESLEAGRQHISIGSIADSVAHNLNNVLGIIFGYMHLLKTHHEKPEMVLKHHASLEAAVNKAAELVRRFGDAARETHAEPEPVQVAELLDRSVERFRRENNISRTFTFTVDPNDLWMNTRASQVESALVALLKNAWESYGSAPESDRVIEISADAGEDDQVAIRIRDRGCGLDPEITATMFEPFSGTKESDGLGLAIARRCFRNLDGDLFLSDHPEGGVLAEVRHPR